MLTIVLIVLLIILATGGVSYPHWGPNGTPAVRNALYVIAMIVLLALLLHLFVRPLSY